MEVPVRIGNRLVGANQPCLVVAEIGINHNGDLQTTKKLIDAALAANCDAVKFQKRTIELVYSQQRLLQPIESPLGGTYGEVKQALEFNRVQYSEINQYCRSRGVMWFASCWDERSADFIAQFEPPCYKIPSALLTDHKLLVHCRRYGLPLVLSTGMSTIKEIDAAVEVVGTGDLILLHCTSAYPAKNADLNLRVIETLRQRYQVPVGYSGHEQGIATSSAAVTLGACMVERHITLDRQMWGTDQPASIEPAELAQLVHDIRAVECALGDGQKRICESEAPRRAQRKSARSHEALHKLKD